MKYQVKIWSVKDANGEFTPHCKSLMHQVEHDPEPLAKIIKNIVRGLTYTLPVKRIEVKTDTFTATAVNGGGKMEVDVIDMTKRLPGEAVKVFRDWLQVNFEDFEAELRNLREELMRGKGGGDNEQSVNEADIIAPSGDSVKSVDTYEMHVVGQEKPMQIANVPADSVKGV